MLAQDFLQTPFTYQLSHVIVRLLHQPIARHASRQVAFCAIDRDLFGQVDQTHFIAEFKFQPVAFSRCAGKVLHDLMTAQLVRGLRYAVSAQVSRSGAGHLIHLHQWPCHQ